MTTIAASVIQPQLRELFDWWTKRRGDRTMPTMRELNPAVLKPWLPNLLIIGVKEESQFIYHYYGSSFIDAFGTNMAGRTIDSLPEAQRDLIRHEYDYVCQRKRPTWRVYSGDFDGEIVTWERLILPFGNEHGQVVTLVVGVYEMKNVGLFEVESANAAAPAPR
jgi:hypothetical protein